MKTIVFCLLLLSLLPCMGQTTPQQPPKKQVWEFNDLEGWKKTSQDDNPDHQSSLANGKLKIFTRKGSFDRKKVHTVDKIYTTGRYKWKTYIPKIPIGDQSSIGSWIYCDDKHEIDFEVGSGTAAERKRLNAQKDDLVAQMTTQANPYSSKAVLIQSGWHTFEIDLSSVNGKYKVQWIIDGKTLHSIQQSFGPDEYAFYIFCSVENLKFLGDHPATKDNYGVFDRVEYTWHP